MVTAGPRAVEAVQQLGLVYAHVGQYHGDVGGRGAMTARKLADTVDRVMIIERQQILITQLKRICLAHKLERCARIRGENDHVLLWRSIEEAQDVLPGLLDKPCCGHRGRV